MISIIITVIAGLFFVIGYFIALNKKDNDNLTAFSIGMAFSVLILLVALDIFPEVKELLNNKYLYGLISILLGFSIFKIIDLFIPHHNHELEKKHKTHEKHLYHIGIITSLALVIHNIIEGLGIYELANYNLYSGFLMSLGVGLHNLPFGLEITATMQEKNENKRFIRNTIFLLFISTSIGALIGFIFGSINELFLGLLMSFSIGMILYLLIFELLGEIKESTNKKYSLIGDICGIIIMILTIVIGG